MSCHCMLCYYIFLISFYGCRVYIICPPSKEALECPVSFCVVFWTLCGIGFHILLIMYCVDHWKKDNVEIAWNCMTWLFWSCWWFMMGKIESVCGIPCKMTLHAHVDAIRIGRIVISHSWSKKWVGIPITNEIPLLFL